MWIPTLVLKTLESFYQFLLSTIVFNFEQSPFKLFYVPHFDLFYYHTFSPHISIFFYCHSLSTNISNFFLFRTLFFLPLRKLSQIHTRIRTFSATISRNLNELHEKTISEIKLFFSSFFLPFFFSNPTPFECLSNHRKLREDHPRKERKKNHSDFSEK